MARQGSVLTDIAVRRAVSAAKAFNLYDTGGLYVTVAPTGAKWWRLKYQFAGRERRMGLGRYPEVGMTEARQLRDDARAKLRRGIDPGAQRRSQRLAGQLAAENGFEAIAREWLETKQGQWVPDQSVKVRTWLESHVFPWIGRRPIAELEAPELLSVLRRLVTRGTLNTAGRVRETISAIFRYAIATGRVQRNPAADLRDALPKATQKNFAALTNPAEVAELLRAIDGYQGLPVTFSALRLSPLLFQRPGEIRAMEWSELDLDAAEWRIPPSRRKLRKAAKENPRTLPHIVPLSTQAVQILRELQRLTGDGKLVFPSVRSRQRPMSDNTVNGALRRLGYSKEQMTGHGFRHMASTLLNELGWNPDAIERQLSHRDRDEVRGTYNLAQYMAERREMMQGWADYLDALKTGANVVPIRKRAS